MGDDLLDHARQLRRSARCSRAMAPELAKWAEEAPDGAALGIWKDNGIEVKLFLRFQDAIAFRRTLPAADRGSCPVIPLQKKISLCISRPENEQEY